MDWSRTPLVECFERGEAPRDIRLMAASGGLALRVPEHLALLMTLVSDPDAEVAARARSTVSRLPADTVETFLSNPGVPEEVRRFFLAAPEGPTGSDAPGAAAVAEPAVPADGPEAGAAPAEEQEPPEPVSAARRLATMNVAGRIKVAIQGTREERQILIRDPNRIVSAAVLSSPKLTEGDVEAIARMTNVSDEVLRVVGTHRTWIKNYTVVAALARNAKTPVGVSLTLLPRLTERDVKILSVDRNVPEPVRLGARKLVVRNQSRRQ
mgnify:CR=1 FL=1